MMYTFSNKFFLPQPTTFLTIKMALKKKTKQTDPHKIQNVRKVRRIVAYYEIKVKNVSTCALVLTSVEPR